MELFERCKEVSRKLNSGFESDARNDVIEILSEQKSTGHELPEFLTALIRQVGLYPYMLPGKKGWTDDFLLACYSFDVGEEMPVVMHREQARIFERLERGDSLAISAPTSFGKSYIIDAYICNTNPKNVVIVVPTIALTDETRRRIFRKFGSEYSVITGSDMSPSEKNIYIFPQERALQCCDSIGEIDLLVIDEFYKASVDFDKERSHSLIRAMILLGAKAKQRYYLAPNISILPDSPVTKGMSFEEIKFNTVRTKIIDRYSKGLTDDQRFAITKDVISAPRAKTLIYAGNYPTIGRIQKYILSELTPKRNDLLKSFAQWIRETYSPTYSLADLVIRETGIHNGQLPRSLSQLQIRLFEEERGLKNLISTSSIIEGVNTCAENVIIWCSKSGQPRINNFTYKNIVGRGGRMFKHFIGHVYLLDKVPDESQTHLNLTVDGSNFFGDPEDVLRDTLSSLDLEKRTDFQTEIRGIVGDKAFSTMLNSDISIQGDHNFIKKMASEVKSKKPQCKTFVMLNSSDTSTWEAALKFAAYNSGHFPVKPEALVDFVKIISKNWERPLTETIEELAFSEITINNYFDLEKNATYRLANTLGAMNSLIKSIHPDITADASPFIARLSTAFLPRNVYALEEYGLPRSLSRKIHDHGIVNFEDDNISLNSAIDILRKVGRGKIKEITTGASGFEPYIVDYFFDGIEIQKKSKR